MRRVLFGSLALFFLATVPAWGQFQPPPIVPIPIPGGDIVPAPGPGIINSGFAPALVILAWVPPSQIIGARSPSGTISV
jgi:hypothetical protein